MNRGPLGPPATPGRPEVRIVGDAPALFRAAADEFARLARESVARSGRFAVALSGGSTPRGLYRLLSEPDPSLPRIPWHGVHLFWGDERHVPPDHPESNYRMVRETLLDEIDIPAGHVHRIPAERADAGAAADEYEDELRGFFGLRTGVLPRFDLVLLGLGRDGHTASLFPGSEALRESRRAVVATRAEGPLPRRISLTMPAINNAARVVFLVSGADKAEALRRVVRGRATIDSPPARWVRPAGGALWIVDRAAARLLAG